MEGDGGGGGEGIAGVRVVIGNDEMHAREMLEKFSD